MKLRSAATIILALAIVSTAAFGGGNGPRTKLVSKTSAGAAADGDSFFSEVSASGRYVVFSSSAANLPGTVGGTVTQAFLRDRRTRKTELISKTSGGDPAIGDSGDPSVSANGRFVAFESDAINLPASLGMPGVDQIYLRDRRTGRTRLVSKTSGGDPGDADSEDPVISRSGRFVAFEGKSSNFPGALPGDLDQTYVRDRRAGKTKLISRTSGGDPADGASDDPAISAKGRFVAFQSEASNLPGALGGGDTQVYVRDQKRRRTRLASQTTGEVPGDGDSFDPLISANGRFVGFPSQATNLPGSGLASSQAYLRDRKRGRTILVSRTSSGAPVSGVFSAAPYPSNTGRFVLFLSDATNLPGDSTQVYLRDRKRGRTRLTSRTNAGDPVDGFANVPLNRTLTGDSRLAFFSADAANLPGPGVQAYSRGR